MIIYQTQTKEEKGVHKNILLKIFYYVLILCIGILIGAIFCNWTYFTFKKEVSINELATLLVSSFLAVYIGNNIQNAVSRKQNDHELLVDEIKRILLHLDKIEPWLEQMKLPFDDCKHYFRKASMNIGDLKVLFISSSSELITELESIRKKFAEFQQTALIDSPVGGNINISQAEMTALESNYREIRTSLLSLIRKQ